MGDYSNLEGEIIIYVENCHPESNVWKYLAGTQTVFPINQRPALTPMLRLQDEKVPWASIFTSVPVWTINMCHFARSFIFFLLLTNGPTYLNVFGYNIAEVSTHPYTHPTQTRRTFHPGGCRWTSHVRKEA